MLRYRLPVDLYLRCNVLLGNASRNGSLGLGLVLSLLFRLLVVGALVLGDVGEDVVGQDAEDQEEPE